MPSSKLKALLADYWIGSFLSTICALYLAISFWLGRIVFSLVIVWMCSFVSALTFRLAYSFVEVFVEKMFKRAKYLVILSGFTSGLIIVILLLVYPFDTVIESFNSFVKYLISIAPSVILIVLGLLSGFLLAPLFYSKLETVE
jgi:hypothetical protein